MPANTTPIFPLTPKVSYGTITTADTSYTGTGTAGQKAVVFTATGTATGFGARIDQIKVKALGSNVTTVLRFFVNNGSDNTVAANNSLVHEATISQTTTSNVAALVDNNITISVGAETRVPIPYIPAGYNVFVTIGTAVSAGLQVTVHGGEY